MKTVSVFSALKIIASGLVITIICFHVQLLSQNTRQQPRKYKIKTIVACNNSDVFVSTNEKIYKWCEGLNSWNIIEGLNDKIGTIAVDKNDDLYATTINGIYKKKKDGKSWDKIGQGPGIDFEINLLAIDNNKNMFATLLKEDGVFKLGGGSKTWIKMRAEYVINLTTSIAIHKDDIICLGKGNGTIFYIKPMNREEFFSVSSITVPRPSHRTWIAPKTNGETVLITTEGNIWLSKDYCQNWCFLNSVLTDVLRKYSGDKTKTSFPDIESVFFGPTGKNVVSAFTIDKKDRFLVATEVGIFHSNDLGETWQMLGDFAAILK